MLAVFALVVVIIFAFWKNNFTPPKMSAMVLSWLAVNHPISTACFAVHGNVGLVGLNKISFTCTISFLLQIVSCLSSAAKLFV